MFGPYKNRTCHDPKSLGAVKMHCVFYPFGSGSSGLKITILVSARPSYDQHAPFANLYLSSCHAYATVHRIFLHGDTPTGAPSAATGHFFLYQHGFHRGQVYDQILLHKSHLGSLLVGILGCSGIIWEEITQCVQFLFFQIIGKF